MTRVCIVEGCGKPHLARGYCAGHYRQAKLRGDMGISPLRYHRPKSRPGEGHIRYDGYRAISVDKRNVLEHRHLMEQHLGRPLAKHETVHHINGVRHDNRLENLELWSKSHPSGQRVADKIAWAKAFLTEYGETA